MHSKQDTYPSNRQHVLVIAHCFDADFSMESRLSWLRAKNAASKYDTTVICTEPYDGLRCDLQPDIPGLNVVAVPHTAFEKLLIRTPFGFYLAYRMWHLRVLRLARQLHNEKRFSMVHQVSYCGYREPGYCWTLDVPFVWGPIGGTQNVPWRFLPTCDPIGAIKEIWRSFANSLQLRYGIRVGKALRAAKAVYVANQAAADSFRAARGVNLACQLETGLEYVRDRPRPVRDAKRPFRLLWAGRLESWKGLPLLLKAVAKLPRDVDMTLRVLGSGTRERCLKRLAERLNIADRIEWVPLPDYNARDEHYRWADAFAFTSLRDTSGTGLLESLAEGVAVIGLDHQGAHDILSSDCAIKVPVRSPRQVIGDIADGIEKLAGDSQLLARLSDGALQRANRYRWEELNAEMLACYGQVLRGTMDQRKETSRDPAVELTPMSGVSV